MPTAVTVSIANQALITALPGPFDQIGDLPDGRRVLKHNVHNTLMLRNSGYDIPSPLELYYDWPGGPPYDVQRKSATLLVENKRAYLLNQQGTGKTRTSLWAWDYLNRQGAAGKLLIVAKLSTLNFVWNREAARLFLGRRCVVLGSDKGMTKFKRLELLDDPQAEIFIINHDGLKVIHEELAARTDIDTLILDELAVYRNNSDRSKGMRSFATRFKYVWGLSGSPMPNAPTDVWAQCKILTPHSVPKYFRACRDTLMNRVSQYEWKPKADAIDKAFAYMQPSKRYSLDDVVELPPLVQRYVDVELSDDQQDFYKEFRKNLAILIQNKKITAANAGAALNKLLQISGGWVYTTPPDFIKLDAKPRLNLLRDLIEDNDQKVLVFAPYRHMVAGIGEFLNSKEGLGANSTAVIGDKGRDAILSAFQDTDQFKALVSHPGPIGHGNTLHRANMVIWYCPISDYDIFDQANFRIRRIGQEHRQQILYMQATAAEKRFYGILRRKENLQAAFLDMVEEASRED